MPRRRLAASTMVLAAGVCLPPASSVAGDAASAAPPPVKIAAPVVFRPAERAVSSWRGEAADRLLLTADQVAALRGPATPPRVARCVKLNNYWCIKKAGWDGEIAADGDGHVAFASAVEGAAVAALLLKRYYVDFNRHTAMSIISHWAPAQCGVMAGGPPAPRPAATPARLASTLRGRWLAGHARGFVTPIAGRKARVRRSAVADHVAAMMPAPTIAAGLGVADKPMRPMTLDALLRSSPNAPPSRSMLGMPRFRGKGRTAVPASQVSLSGCGYDGARIAAYATKAATGIATGADGDLGLFNADGTPTANLSIMMMNMARVEIGPLGPQPALIQDGIAQAFRPGRNPAKS